MADAHSLYAALRESSPVRQVVYPNAFRAWLVTRYADVRTALASPHTSRDFSRAMDLVERHRDGDGAVARFAAELVAHMLNTDPPDHTRLRKLVNRAFTVRGVETLRPRVQQITDELLDGMSGEVDLLSALAFPLPMTVICEVLGVPDGDRDAFRHWSSVVLSSAPPAEIDAASAEMAGYLMALVADKRGTPGDDLLTALIQVSEDGDRLTEPELISMAFLLLVAGHETTVNLIGNGVLALLNNPDQLALLRSSPDLLTGAVEEFLRYDSPVNMATIRFTTAPLELGGVVVPEGEFLLLALAGANRDPERFPEPDALDVTRAPSAHLAFGHGIHYCVGAPLARMEGEIAIGSLLARFPDIALATDLSALRYRESPLLRGLVELPVTLG